MRRSIPRAPLPTPQKSCFRIRSIRGRTPNSANPLPPTYVFEGMRALLMDHVFRADLMADALAINVVLFMASFATFLVLLRSARRHGSLIQSVE